MRHVKSILGVTCAAALLMAVTAQPAAAQNFNRHTVVTFSSPVELPGITLPAGTYTFRLSDSTSDRHIVHVLDADGEKHIATVMAKPATRSAVSEETVVTFRETAANQPLPIRYWYYPNDTFGQEFAYPRERALAIAQATGESVLAVEGEEITRVEATVAEPAPVTVPTPTPTPTPTPMPTPVQPVEPAPVVEPEPVEPVGTSGRLPETAGELPLVGLIGLLALGGALAMRAIRRSAA
ncbi:MAG TPA: hypothetical protein VFZ36_07220 [Vicinamibacterales bacterium]